MPSQCDPLSGNFSNYFERKLYEHLCKNLQNAPSSYWILGPLDIPRRHIEIDGLVISSHCVFSLEAKAYKGKVQKDFNSRITVTTENGLVDDFSERYVDPYSQAEKQWKTISLFFQKDCGINGVWVKSILVFETGSSFDVPSENRNINDPTVPYICSLDEVLGLVQNLRSPKNLDLTPEIQSALVRAIKFGPEKLTPTERKVLEGASSGKRRGNDGEQPLENEHPPKPKPQWSWYRSCIGAAFIIVGLLVLFSVLKPNIQLPSLGNILSNLELPRITDIWNDLNIEERLKQMVGPVLSVETPVMGEPGTPPGAVVTGSSGLRACEEAHSVTVRKGPSVDAGKLDEKNPYLYKGECVILIGRNVEATWVQFERGWITAEYLEIEGDILTLPVVNVSK